jgi:hypothetical protein
VLELLARRDTELDEDLPEMPLDGPDTQEQLGSDLGVGPPIASEPGNLLLLRGQGVTRGEIEARLAGDIEAWPTNVIRIGRALRIPGIELRALLGFDPAA